MCKENKNNDFIQQFFSFCVTILRHNREYHDSCVCILLFVNKLQCMLVRWKAACSTGSENSWISSKKKKIVWSEDEQRSYMFGMTWGRVINDRIFIFGWTNLLTSFTRTHARTHARTRTWVHSLCCMAQRSQLVWESHGTADQTQPLDPTHDCTGSSSCALLMHITYSTRHTQVQTHVCDLDKERKKKVPHCILQISKKHWTGWPSQH